MQSQHVRLEPKVQSPTSPNPCCRSTSPCTDCSLEGAGEESVSALSKLASLEMVRLGGYLDPPAHAFIVIRVLPPNHRRGSQC